MIRVLDKFIADKIAAGEVIERPVSAVKELIENSIDAGAGSIIVEIRAGGKSYIRVTDDGCGIPSEETETAFLRHATSKISGIADLDNISSLGFRGEALASISAVSRLTMVTRTAESISGTRIVLHGGRVISRETTGANKGTTIVVEDLFYNTPARRKFMASDAREASAVIEIVEQYAICYSDIRFMMIRNGETVFTTSGDGDTLSAVLSVYPDPEHSGLIEVSGSNVRGYVSDPMTVKNTRRGQLFFVNGRLVSSPVIEKGLETGYRGRIFSGHPVAILFITADPHDIDVNIHPGKRQIKFLRSDQVVSDIASAVDEAMKSREAVPSYKPSSAADDNSFVTSEERSVRVQEIPAGEQTSIREFLSSPERRAAGQSEQSDYSSGPSAEYKDAADAHPSDDGDNVYIAGVREERPIYGRSPVTDTDPASDLPKAAERELFSFEGLIFKGYVFDTYIIMQSEDTVYFFDQHAAHERINYERFLSAYLNSEQYPQPVLTPVTINVSADVYYIAKDMLEPLIRMGYDISDFGSGTFIMRGVPAYVTLGEAESFVRKYLEETAQEGGSGLNTAVVDKLIMRSCKASVKGGEKLSEREVTDLISRLSECRDPYACPHGRPTFIRYTRYDIERSFKRR